MNKKIYDNICYEKGVSLLEILISILIGTIMMLAITTMYSHFSNMSRLQEEQSNAQDQANFAFLTLNRAVRMSGAGLCVNPTVDEDSYLHQATPFGTVWQALVKYKLINDDNESKSMFEKFTDQSRLHSFTVPENKEDKCSGICPVEGSDALLVMYSDNRVRRIIGSVKSGVGNELLPAQESSRFHRRKLNAPRTASDPVFYKDRNTWVMISDCNHTGILQYTKDKAPSENSDILPLPENGNFLYNFGGNGEETLIGRLHAQLYFIAKDPKSELSQLYVRNLLAPDTDAKPLAVYIENMKIQYRNPSTGSWVEGSARTDWSEDWPVEVTLTMNSGSQLGTQTYSRVLGIRN